jgi:hypothetical protein
MTVNTSLVIEFLPFCRLKEEIVIRTNRSCFNWKSAVKKPWNQAKHTLGHWKTTRSWHPWRKKKRLKSFVKMLREFRLILGVPQHVPKMKWELNFGTAIVNSQICAHYRFMFTFFVTCLQLASPLMITKFIQAIDDGWTLLKLLNFCYLFKGGNSRFAKVYDRMNT